MFRVCLLILLGLLMAPGVDAEEAPAPNVAASSLLNQALANGDLDKVLALARRLPANDLVDAADLPAQRGLVPAMWVMGQARYLQGNISDSARWMYLALLGTRLDLALCKDSEADGVMGLWVDALRPAVTASRQDVNVRSEAIRQAVLHYQQFPQDTQPGWTCRWAMAQHLIRPVQEARLMVSERQWVEARRSALLRFCKEVGLGNGQTSDLWSTGNALGSF